MSDGMLTGDLAFQLSTFGIGLVHDDLDPSFDLFLLQFVGAAVNMQVAVSGMSKVADTDTVFLAQ